MRRILAVLAAMSCGVAAGERPVGAHACGEPARVELGEPFIVRVGVAAEEFAVIEVSIGIPEGLRINGADDVDGWTVERSEDAVRYTGQTAPASTTTRDGPLEGSTGGNAAEGTGRIGALGCGFFTLRGDAEKPGTYRLPITVVGGNGEHRTYADEAPGSAGPQLIHVGAGSAPAESSTGERGVSPWLVGGLVAAGGALIGAAVMRNRWTAAPARAPNTRRAAPRRGPKRRR